MIGASSTGSARLRGPLSGASAAVWVAALAISAFPAAGQKPRWHTLVLHPLGCELSVPVMPPRFEEGLQISADGGSLPAGAKQLYIRIQNFAEDDLIPGEVPRLRPGHFVFEVHTRAAAASQDEQEAASCIGDVARFSRPAPGAWCRFNPDLNEGEGSITHVAWFWRDGIQFHLAIDGSQLQEGAPKRMLTSLRCP